MKHHAAYLMALMLCWATAAAQNAPEDGSGQPFIPAGSKIALVLKQAISTRNAKAGDPVYAESVFPFFAGNRTLVPAGTTVLGVITRVKRAGRTRGRAEIQMSFTSMIYSDGYSVPLSGYVDNVPGADHLSATGAEGAIQQGSDTAMKAADGGRNAAHGAFVGGAGGLFLGQSLTAMRVGGGMGIAVGLAWALFRRGGDVRLEPGTHIEMAIARQITVDAAHLPSLQPNRPQ